MARTFGSARALLAGAVGIASMFGGGALAFELVTPQMVGRLSTVELVGLLGLLVLPMVLGWTLMVERRASLRAREEAAPAIPFVRVEVKPMRCPGCDRAMVGHDAEECVRGASEEIMV